MLRLEVKPDFFQDIRKKVKEMMLTYYELEIQRSNKDTSLDVVQEYTFTPVLVGQERNGIFIFTWCFPDSCFAKTFVALYDRIIGQTNLIFTQEKLINIINASINCTQTVLAFSVREKNLSEGYVSPSEAGDIFKSYIAEVAPQNRVFSLNVEWRTYQKVQFLHEQLQVNKKVSHLIFFHHKESIGLYHVPVASCDNRYIMSKQPTTKKIIGQFLWSQFDMHSQRLYFVKLYPQDEEEINATALFTVVEFKTDGDFEYILNCPLPISFKMEAMQRQSLYFDRYISSMVAAQTFNFSVITIKPGSFYICYQHLQEKPQDNSLENDDSSKASSSSSLPSDNSEMGYHVTYAICCIHGGYKLQCTAAYSNDIFSQEPVRIFFTPFHDYIVAYLPGSFLHLLDISCEHEPAHNLLFQEAINDPPFMLNWDSETSPLFSIVWEDPNLHNPYIYENSTEVVYRFELDQKSLYRLFLYSKPSSRIAILHACMNHFKERKLVRRMIERVCLDPANVETGEILKEYLVSTAYNQMKKIVPALLDLKLFPFTSVETSRGQVERNENGERTVYLFYKRFSENLVRQIQKILTSNKNPYWSTVSSHLSHAFDHRNGRFPLSLLNLAGIDMNASFPDKVLSRSFTSLGRASARPRTESTGSLPEVAVNLKECRESEHKNYVATEKMVHFIGRAYGKATKNKASSMCHEYATARSKTMITLWRIILKSLNFSTEESLLSKNLNEQGSDFELALFQLLERLKVILEQLCHPGFPGMSQLFVCLGFRCLSRHQFVQYLDACVFDLDVDVVTHILYNAEDSSENVAIKNKLASKLSKEHSNMAVKEWRNSANHKDLAAQIMSKLPSEEMHTTNLSEMNEMSEDFVPLRTLMQSVKMCGQKPGILQNRNKNFVNEQSIKFITDMAMSETDMLISQR